MSKKKNQDGRVWLYHDDCPQGRIFDKPDLDEMADDGWVRTPADLDLPEEEKAEELTEEQVKGFRPEDMVARVKDMGFAVLTPDELKAELVKHVDSLPAVTPLAVADISDDALLKEVTERGLIVPAGSDKFTLSERFNEDPKSLTKVEHIALGKELGLTLRKTWSEGVMIEKITAKLNEAG